MCLRWLLALLLLFCGAIGCRSTQKKEEEPVRTVIPTPEVASPVPIPLPEETAEEPKRATNANVIPVYLSPDDPRLAELDALERKVSALEEQLAAAERELAEAQAKMEQSGVARKSRKVKNDLGDVYDTAERRCNAVNDAVKGGER